MTEVQFHGLKFESDVRSAMNPHSNNEGRKTNALFDVEAKFDKILTLATSVKAAKNNKLSSSISLASAQNFWSVDEAFRMVVGLFTQEAGYKVFREIHEFIVHGDMLGRLKGEITFEEVDAIDKGMDWQYFPLGRAVSCREWAVKEKEALESKRGLVQLNHKASDSPGSRARRLQCSITLRNMIKATENHHTYCSTSSKGRVVASNFNYLVHTSDFFSMPLPHRIKSDARTFKPK